MKSPSRLSPLVMAALVALAAAGSSIAAPSPARADHDIDTPFTGTRPMQLEFHAGFTWYGLGFAGGARFGIPLVHNGFVPSLDNALYLNFGLDAYFIRYRGPCGGGTCFDDYFFALGIPVTLHWQFYFTDQWSAFGEIGFQVFFPPSLWHNGRWDYDGGYIGAWVVGAVGGSFHVSDAFVLTLRVGNPYVSFGIEFQF